MDLTPGELFQWMHKETSKKKSDTRNSLIDLARTAKTKLKKTARSNFVAGQSSFKAAPKGNNYLGTNVTKVHCWGGKGKTKKLLRTGAYCEGTIISFVDWHHQLPEEALLKD